ncbi:NUDIX domain-containing protein [Streptomyces albus]|uniref:NUDIX domain-containing protein n=1 Tax=Streptomyces albus TaxID=1888 RepID=UPI0037004BE0
MPPSRSHIRTTVDAYLRRHPQEREALSGLPPLLEDASEPCNRATLPAHLTCGAVVIDRELRVLHIGHKASGGKLLAPGGHVEADDRSLLATALREVHEETGLRPRDLCLTPRFLAAPIDIDVHDIDANPAKGEPAHRHYDVRFAFYLAAEGPPPPLALAADEICAARWLPLTDVRCPKLRAKLLAAAGDGLDGRPEPVNASALLHDGRGRYLLHLRDQLDGIREPGTFALPGGGREVDDASTEATLRRELAEEAPGLEPAELTPYAVEETTDTDGLAMRVQIYSGRWNGDPDAIDLREGVMLRWFTPDMLDRLRLSPGLGELIRRHAAEHPPAAGPRDSGRRRPAAPLPDGTALHVVGVHLYLQDERGRVLLGLRHPDAEFGANQWHLLAGHCMRESALACLCREAREEAGLTVDPAGAELVHLVHLADPPGAHPRMQLFFRAASWSGSPEVLEPDRCLAWRWWEPKDLPAETVPYTRLAIEGILAGRRYSEPGGDGR